MAKTFLELFSKYSPSDEDAVILRGVISYTAKADKELRIISCDVVFPSYVPFHILSKIENDIACAYELNRMEIHPTFENTPFDEILY